MVASVSDEQQIRRVRIASNEAIARHDVPGIQAVLDDDYQVVNGAGDFINSREAMGEGFVQRFARFEDLLYVRTTETVEVGTTGTIAAETGHWVGTWSAPEGEIRQGGRYSAYWRKINGEWRIHAEQFVRLF